MNRLPYTMEFRFADANGSYEQSKYVILGVPYDRTTSFRPGTRFAPQAIRQVSWNFELYSYRHNIKFTEIPVHDGGDVEECGSTEELWTKLEELASKIFGDGKFPVIIGGEHSITPPIIKAMKAHHKEVGVLIIDAHMDFRDSYLNDKCSHACSTRRITELIGVNNTLLMGFRSASEEEFQDAKTAKLNFIDIYQIHSEGFENSLKKALNIIKTEKLYLSIDIDGIDPAYAPGTGTPEPFGLISFDLLTLISKIHSRLIGMDIVEINPIFDNSGITSALATKIIRETITMHWTSVKRLNV